MSSQENTANEVQPRTQPDFYQKLLQEIATEALEALEADQSFVLLQDAIGELEIVAEVSSREMGYTDVSTSVCNLAMKGDPILIADATADDILRTEGPSKYRRLQKYTPSQSVIRMRLKSIVAVPLLPSTGRSPFGILYVCSYSAKHSFNEEDRTALAEFANEHAQFLEVIRQQEVNDALLNKAAFIMEDRKQLVDIALKDNIANSTQARYSLEEAIKLMGHILDRVVVSDSGAHFLRVDAEELRHIHFLAKEADKHNRKVYTELDVVKAYWEIGSTFSTEPERTSPQEWVEIRERLQNQFSESKLTIFSDLPASPALSAAMLEELLRQVIQNAYQAGADTVGVEATVYKGTNLILNVQDNGPGATNSVARRMPEWRYRYDPQEYRRGIGLYIVKQLVSLAGGQLHIEPMKKGLRVSALLPTVG